MKHAIAVTAILSGLLACTVQAAESATPDTDHQTGTLISSSNADSRVKLTTGGIVKKVYVKVDDSIAFDIRNQTGSDQTIQLVTPRLQDTVGTADQGKTTSFGWNFADTVRGGPVKVIAKHDGQTQLLALVYVSPVGGGNH